MFTPEKMDQVHVVFFEKDVDRVADTVVRQGTLQIVDAADMESWAEELMRVGRGEKTTEMEERQKKIEALLNDLEITPDLSSAAPSEELWGKLDQKIADIEDSVREEVSSKKRIENELTRLNEFRGLLEGAPILELPILESRDRYSYLAVEVGQLAEENMEILKHNLEPILHVLYPMGRSEGMVTVMVIALKRDQERLRSAMKETGVEPAVWEKEKELPSPEILKNLDPEIKRLKEKAFLIDEKLRKMAFESKEFLRSVLFRLRRDILKQEILKYFRKTERTYLLSGWLPREDREDFVRKILRATQNRCVVETVPAEKVLSVQKGEVQVPVQLKNPSLLKPFEFLTKTYGIPAYHSIDPTPILGISFLLMFGMMFGDVGHGLILALLGVFMAKKGQKKTYKSAGILLFYAGCASIIFGFLFGSIFGLEHLIPTLWIKPMESISQLFKVAIFFGIGMISLAILVNVINGILRRDFLGMIFDKAGLLAAVIYWCGIIVVTRMLTTEAEAKGEVPLFVPILMLTSVVLLFLREPIVHLFRGKRKLFPEGVLTGIMGGGVEILEIFLGFLANTVSFIRVAAFGLAHVGLFMAIFSLSDAVHGMAGGIVSALVLIFGNILIIALEGLVVSIQAVRLEFYEFFSRFFQESDVAYKPLKAELKPE